MYDLNKNRGSVLLYTFSKKDKARFIIEDPTYSLEGAMQCYDLKTNPFLPTIRHCINENRYNNLNETRMTMRLARTVCAGAAAGPPDGGVGGMGRERHRRYSSGMAVNQLTPTKVRLFVEAKPATSKRHLQI